MTPEQIEAALQRVAEWLDTDMALETDLDGMGACDTAHAVLDRVRKELAGGEPCRQS